MGKPLHDFLHARREARLVGQGHATKLEIVEHAQFRKNIPALRYVDDSLVENLTGREIRGLATIEGNPATTHREQTEDCLEHRRLARAIRADHGRDRSAANAGACPIKDRHFAITGKDIIQDEQ